MNCGPRGLPPGVHSLYRNTGKGTFTDVSEASGISRARGSYGMSAVAADFDNDGWPDIYLACDSTPSLLYHNNKDGTFREIAGVCAEMGWREPLWLETTVEDPGTGQAKQSRAQ